VTIGVWLTRGSRHEPADRAGIAHFVEHMLFKGTATRSAESIAQDIDSIGGQLDAFTLDTYAVALYRSGQHARCEEVAKRLYQAAGAKRCGGSSSPPPAAPSATARKPRSPRPPSPRP
jgi:predicted Zn-dependent peptidase